MPVKYLIAAFLLLLLSGSTSPDPFPQAEITNGIIRARLYLPDNKEGYYRGSRFDWSGVMPELEFKGHTYFGSWFEKYDPYLHDAIMGPVEEFSAIGYDAAKVGENFLKIGVGMLIKPEESKYFFATPYKIANGGNWKVKKKSDQVTFLHKFVDKEYAYQYEKTVQLVKDKPELVLSHSLTNTGKQPIETNVYNHNFFVMDNQPIGPDYTVTFPFNPVDESGATLPLGRLQDNQILFHRELTGNDHLFYRSLLGFGTGAEDYDIKIENHKTGAAVRITCDQPLARLVFWSAPKTLCPEPYIHIKLNPGETFTWSIFYQFYLCDIIPK